MTKCLIANHKVKNMINKVKEGYRLVSHTGKNLGTYSSKAGVEKREKQVNMFKHMKDHVGGNQKGMRRDNPNHSMY